MKAGKVLKLCIIFINLVGVICLIYFSIPYLTHDITIAHPDAMLPMQAWERAGMILTFGFIPILAANVLSFLFIKIKQKYVRFLFFIPSATCLFIAGSYWIESLS